VAEICERTYLAAHAPAAPVWFYKKVVKALREQKTLRFDAVTDAQHEGVQAQWPWYWADMVMKAKEVKEVKEAK